MSNYKPRIESNNLDLTSILATINELPDAGGGSVEVETCTVNVHVSVDFDSAAVSYTTVVDGSIRVITNKPLTEQDNEFVVVKGTALTIRCDYMSEGMYISGLVYGYPNYEFQLPSATNPGDETYACFLCLGDGHINVPFGY